MSQCVVCILLAMFLFTPHILFAGYEEGVKAAQKGLYSSAIKEFQKAADLGDARAQYSLGIMYNDGIGTKKDSGKARHLFQKAAAQGHPLAKQALKLPNK